MLTAWSLGEEAGVWGCLRGNGWGASYVNAVHTMALAQFGDWTQKPLACVFKMGKSYVKYTSRKLSLLLDLSEWTGQPL